MTTPPLTFFLLSLIFLLLVPSIISSLSVPMSEKNQLEEIYHGFELFSNYIPPLRPDLRKESEKLIKMLAQDPFPGFEPSRDCAKQFIEYMVQQLPQAESDSLIPMFKALSL